MEKEGELLQLCVWSAELNSYGYGFSSSSLNLQFLFELMFNSLQSYEVNLQMQRSYWESSNSSFYDEITSFNSKEADLLFLRSRFCSDNDSSENDEENPLFYRFSSQRISDFAIYISGPKRWSWAFNIYSKILYYIY